MSYSREGAERLYTDAMDYGLSGAGLLTDTAAVQRDCNGVGADWMPEKMRYLCTKMNYVMELPAAIHDRRYAIGGSSFERLKADAEFLANTLIVIESEYKWYNPKRYIMSCRAKRYYSLLRTFGNLAWKVV